jgi:hypothetical protein
VAATSDELASAGDGAIASASTRSGTTSKRMSCQGS